MEIFTQPDAGAPTLAPNRYYTMIGASRDNSTLHCAVLRCTNKTKNKQTDTARLVPHLLVVLKAHLFYKRVDQEKGVLRRRTQID